MAQQPEYQQTVSEAKTLPPMRIGEVVLKTARFDAMNGWWQTVLGISPFLESERFAFRRLSGDYPYTQLLRVSSGGTRSLPYDVGMQLDATQQQRKRGSAA